MNKNKYGSMWINVPKGCELCWIGAKMVLFVTGRCNKSCWYCPISEEKKGQDQIYANERPVSKLTDAITEAKEMNALGVGITGGEPFLAADTVVEYVRALKTEFGKAFHAHLYTYGEDVTEKKLKMLEDAGLDEIRFHSLVNVELALKTKMSVGLEVPCIPKQEKYLMSLIDYCKEKNIFINLNEFEFSETNSDALKAQGYKPVGDFNYAVKGSKLLAIRLLDYARKVGVNAHFCSVKTKNTLQLTERLKRRAAIVKKPWESVDEYGMLEYGLVECKKDNVSNFKLEYSERHGGAVCTVKRAEELAKKGFKAWVIIDYPIYDPWTFEKIPIEINKRQAR